MNKPEITPYTNPILGEALWTMMLELTGHKKEVARRVKRARQWRNL